MKKNLGIVEKGLGLDIFVHIKKIEARGKIILKIFLFTNLGGDDKPSCLNFLTPS